uniref:Proline-rich protein PRCC n=1 Tax=Rhizophora mucronata TaxID=61149 RepID=A0A2P2IH73_RHIMU
MKRKKQFRSQKPTYDFPSFLGWILKAMESLVANYASSDEEEEAHRHHDHHDHREHRLSSTDSPKPTSSCLPPQQPEPPSASLFSSLPQPQTSKHSYSQNFVIEEEDNQNSSLFASLPRPSKTALTPISNPNPKRVVQFKPPVNPSNLDEEDEDGEESERRKRVKQSESLTQSSSVKSFLSSIPAPRHSSALGVLPSAAGSGRRSALETGAPSPSFSTSDGLAQEDVSGAAGKVGNYQNYEDNYPRHELGLGQNGGNYESYGSYASNELGIGEHIHQNVGGVDGSGYGSYANYGDYNSSDGSMASLIPEPAGSSEIAVRRMGKRGRDEIPTEVVEVKQDELMKNRPREDQVKLTGIAFGPSYQPTSTKGKPSKLHKRKHQIGSLYFDMKQKEMEMAERRARGLLTKAQTQGKYGW